MQKRCDSGVWVEHRLFVASPAGVTQVRQGWRGDVPDGDGMDLPLPFSFLPFLKLLRNAAYCDSRSSSVPSSRRDDATDATEWLSSLSFTEPAVLPAWACW